MTFTEIQFPIFFGVCLCVFLLCRKAARRIDALILFSYAFLLTFGLATTITLTAVALADFYISKEIDRAATDEIRKRWLQLGIAVNLAPLVFCKYLGFIFSIVSSIAQVAGLQSGFGGHWTFPIVGLSYFTFAGISYMLDVYNGKMIATESASEYLCYLAFFPKIIAGPIVRAADFLPQLKRGLKVTQLDVEVGVSYLLMGAVKKLVIADQMTGHVNLIFNSPGQYNSVTLLQGVVGYAVQIYCDFSGYSDMAIGCARLLGIRFPQNFQMPYSSVNIAEFWRRWHITMSNWFRDYVFLPLEVNSRGMRSPVVRVSRNLVITMVLCGLWHGASWNFVLWGSLHGFALAIYQIFTTFRGRNAATIQRSAWHPAIIGSRFLTLSTVLLGYIFFGTQNLSVAWTYIVRLATWRTDGVSLGSPYILPLTCIVLIVHLFIRKDDDVVENLAQMSVPIRITVYVCLLLALTSLVPSESVPFVYVRF